MDPSDRKRPRPEWRFPRTRGDGPSADEGYVLRVGFPPHSRGWTLVMDKAEDGEPVSPALAGMDPLGAGRGWAQYRFPRTRGDGP